MCWLLSPATSSSFSSIGHIGRCHFMPDDYSQPPVSPVPSEELCSDCIGINVFTAVSLEGLERVHSLQLFFLAAPVFLYAPLYWSLITTNQKCNGKPQWTQSLFNTTIGIVCDAFCMKKGCRVWNPSIFQPSFLYTFGLLCVTFHYGVF